jgi:hypothetical protein
MVEITGWVAMLVSLDRRLLCTGAVSIVGGEVRLDPDSSASDSFGGDMERARGNTFGGDMERTHGNTEELEAAPASTTGANSRRCGALSPF